MIDAILVLNAGSSSIKFALYPAAQADETALVSGKIENISGNPDFMAHDAKGNSLAEDGLEALKKGASHETFVGQLLEWLSHHHRGMKIAAVGHRVVHGGRLFGGPAIITEEVLVRLQELGSLAPLHQPHNLSAIRAVAAWAPDLLQVACFDTSFHRTLSRLAQLFALPRKLSDDGIIKYGFHGLSYEYIAGVLPKHLGAHASGRVVIAHLGNGASMCAMKNRRSVATTMGFTALDGLMMGRRCGTLDAGVVLHLIQNMQMAPQDVLHILYQEAGLLGVSGISNNMHVLQESNDPNAQEAIDLFCYRAACELCALIVPLEGLDAIVFTAGIGENSSIVRQKICARLGWIGVEIDETANKENATRINAPASNVDVMVIPTDEEAVIARSVQNLIGMAVDDGQTAQ